MPKPLEEGMTWEEIYEHIHIKIGHKLKVTEQTTFKKWFMEREGIGYLFDPILILRCFRIWQDLQRDLDHFIVCSGREGYGKTTLSFAVAAWVTPKGFSLDNVCYGAKRYLDILSKKVEEYVSNKEKTIVNETIVLDEGTELLSRESLNLTNRALAKTFFVQRALKFLVIINIPNFHMLDTIIRNHRVRTLFEITNRGKYKAITGKGIKIVAKEGQNNKEVKGIRLPDGCWWQGYFRKDFPKTINREEYEGHKILAIKDMLDTMKDDVVERKMYSVVKACKEIGCNRMTLINMIKKGEVEGKQVGSKWYLTRKAYDKLITV